MRTIPAPINTGFTQGYLSFRLVKIEASGGIIFYWPTLDKNRAGYKLILKETSGGGALTYDASMIAAETETGEEINGIGEIESSVSLYDGGGVSSVSDVELTILNHDSFDRMIVQQLINIENRPITIYYGFIPEGENPTVVIQDHMFKEYSGLVEDVNEYDYTEYILRCVDATFQRHQDIPVRIITETDYPNAPIEMIGEAIPEIYGDFSQIEALGANNFEDLLITERLSPCPAFLIDSINRQFMLCGHELHYTDNPRGLSPGLVRNIWGDIVYIFPQHDPGQNITSFVLGSFATWARFAWYGLIKGAESTPTLDISAVVDADLNSFVTLNELQEQNRLFLTANIYPKQNFTKLGSIAFYVKFGEIEYGSYGRFCYKIAEGSLIDVRAWNASDANSIISGPFPVTSLDDLKWIQYGIICDYGQAQIKNIHLEGEFDVSPEEMYEITYFLADPRLMPTFPSAVLMT